MEEKKTESAPGDAPCGANGPSCDSGPAEPGASCCCGGTGPSRGPGEAAGCCGAGDTGEGCGCASSPSPRSRIKALISTVVILAALGVGIYSLAASRTADPAAQAAKSGAVTPSAATAMPGPAPAGPAAAGCCGSAGSAAPAQPSCCGGGGGSAALAEPAVAQPSCGEPRKGCCGR